jgi:hypothetical protein
MVHLDTVQLYFMLWFTVEPFLWQTYSRFELNIACTNGLICEVNLIDTNDDEHFYWASHMQIHILTICLCNDLRFNVTFKIIHVVWARWKLWPLFLCRLYKIIRLSLYKLYKIIRFSLYYPQVVNISFLHICLLFYLQDVSLLKVSYTALEPCWLMFLVGSIFLLAM